VKHTLKARRNTSEISETVRSGGGGGRPDIGGGQWHVRGQHNQKSRHGGAGSGQKKAVAGARGRGDTTGTGGRRSDRRRRRRVTTTTVVVSGGGGGVPIPGSSTAVGWYFNPHRFVTNSNDEIWENPPRTARLTTSPSPMKFKATNRYHGSPSGTRLQENVD